MNDPAPNVVGVTEEEKQMTDPCSQEATYNDFSAIAETNCKYAWEGNIWDSSVLLGLTALGVPTSTLVALALILNIVVRACVSWVIHENMVDSQFSDDDVESYKRWRTSDAHSVVYRDISSGQSLVSRVCAGDTSLGVATAQRDLLAIMTTYLAGSSGQVTQIVLMSLLCAVAFPELVSSLGCCVSLLVTPKGPTSLTKVGEGLSLQSIHCCRLASVLFVNILRAVLTIATLWGTLHMIALTVSLVDMFLGFGAAAAIFWGYEALAKTCVPSSLYAVMRAIAPQPLNKGKKLAGVWLASLVVLFGYVLVIVLMFVLTIQPQQESMRGAVDALCSGNLDFIFSFNPDSNPPGMVYSMSSTSLNESLPAAEKQVLSLMLSADTKSFNSVNAGTLWAALDVP